MAKTRQNKGKTKTKQGKNKAKQGKTKKFRGGGEEEGYENATQYDLDIPRNTNFTPLHILNAHL